MLDRLLRLLRSPLLHFAVLGGLLFAWQSVRLASDVESRDERIAISRERVAELVRTFSDVTGRRPGPGELAGLIDAEVEEEILFREAVAEGLLERDSGVKTRLIQKMLFLEGGAELDDAPDLLARATKLGLHHDDIVVRRILVQKMRLLGSALRDDQRVDPSEIQTAYAEARESLRAPERLSLVHVFVSRDKRGAETRSVSEALLRELRREHVAPEAAPALADMFPLGHRLEHRSQTDLQRTFGAHFAQDVFAVPVGEWTGPITSAYGLHLVRVEGREPGEVPPIEMVSEKLRLEIEEDRRQKNLDELMKALRTRYVVRVDQRETPPGAPPSAKSAPSSDRALAAPPRQEPG